MKVHVVLNGCSDSYESQAKQIYGFLQEHCNTLEKGTTIIIGKNTNDKENLLNFAPTAEVKFIWVSRYQTETILDSLVKLVDDSGIYIFGNDSSGCELAVRTAARLKGASAVNVNALEYTQNGIIIGKPIYSNHCQGRFLMKKSPCCLSIAKGSKPKAIEQNEHTISYETHAEQNASAFLAYTECEPIEKTTGLTESKLIIVAGQGVKNKEAINELEIIAKILDGELGVSRPVAMNAWAAMDRLVGVSGSMLAPQICITAGVSGAGAFFAGIEKSDIIVAINTDQNASIMKKADIAIVGDYRPVLQALAKYFEEQISIK